MAKVKVTLESITPMLMNPMSLETLEDIDRGTTKPRDRNKPYNEVAEEKIHRDADGHPAIPAEMLFACLVEAGRLIKYDGKRSMSTASSSLVPSFLTILDQYARIEGEWVVDKRRGNNDVNGKKVAVMVVRPKFDHWKAELTIEVDTDRVNLDKVQALFKEAGACIGLGSFRPASRGQFGKFAVAAWKVLDQNASSNGHAEIDAKKLAKAGK